MTDNTNIISDKAINKKVIRNRRLAIFTSILISFMLGFVVAMSLFMNKSSELNDVINNKYETFKIIEFNKAVDRGLSSENITISPPNIPK